MKQVVIKSKDWKKLEEYFAQRNDIESGAYGIFKVSIADSSIKFLLSKLIIPNDDDYYKRSPVAVAFKPEFTEKTFQIIDETAGHFLDIHNHPWSERVDFSSIDDSEAEKTKIPYFDKYLPETRIAFIVFGKTTTYVKARYWDKSTNQLIGIDRIVVL